MTTRQSGGEFAAHIGFTVLGIALGSLLVRLTPVYVYLPVLVAALYIAWKARP